jgi:hypothetical protein
MLSANRSSHEILIRRAEISLLGEDMDRDFAPLSRNVLPHFSQTERVFLEPTFSHPLRSTSLSRARDNAASKFENRINHAHDVAVVRHNNESAASVPACAA